MTVTTTPTDLDLREALKSVPNALSAVGAVSHEEPAVFVVGTFMEVSLDPPLVSIAVQKQSRTWEKLRDASEIGISVLSAHHNAVVYQLGSKNGDRLNGVNYAVTEDGAVLLEDSAATFLTTIEEEIPAGDHFIVVLRVTDYAAQDVDSLVYANSALHTFPGDNRGQ